ncbi:MAG: hypothetical protein WBC21_04200 [Minisyncoccales bacterium]
MNKIQKIAKQIKLLLDELVVLADEKPNSKSNTKNKVASTTRKGAAGALVILTDEGFFDSPKEISVIMEKLKEIGRHYPQATVAMNLLNLTKRRTFNRLKYKGSKNWLYVLRK